MKKIFGLGILGLSAVTLASCGAPKTDEVIGATYDSYTSIGTFTVEGEVMNRYKFDYIDGDTDYLVGYDYNSADGSFAVVSLIKLDGEYPLVYSYENETWSDGEDSSYTKERILEYICQPSLKADWFNDLEKDGDKYKGSFKEDKFAEIEDYFFFAAFDSSIDSVNYVDSYIKANEEGQLTEYYLKMTDKTDTTSTAEVLYEFMNYNDVEFTIPDVAK